MKDYSFLVTPLANRKTLKSAEQSFVATVQNLNIDVANLKESGLALGIDINGDLASIIDAEIGKVYQDADTVFSVTYFIALSLKNIYDGKRPLYKLELNIVQFEKFKDELKRSITTP